MSLLFSFLLTIFAYAVSEHRIPVIPNPEKTPGHVCTTDNNDFEEFRYIEQIAYCRRNVNWWRRKKIYDAYGIPEECRHRYTIDHFIPLSIGGSNSDKNLWPEHERVKDTRPLFEWEMFLAVRDGEISQDDAIELMIKEKTTLDLDLSDIEDCG